ncbi:MULTISPECIES: 6-carboxytetrahydropterin synthase [Corallococcus]|uniref:6-pyruvoyl trahydropterin synthase family protein n=1 Tax=Corallococcus TaxID=83461 RepID=UPI0011803CFF|nr:MULTISPECIES: 6-carboxytetrahydropterin synthase [Corallococcus]NBD07918.1 folate biosynthesis protein [Corallococcus silvisoli]TSC33901.1 folate biosynthesis protein [Corallococcus sp. Z5C101001]
MARTTTLELHKEEMKFSAGHFTIFSATHRENLHGHNFSVYVALTGEVSDDGLLSDYGPLKQAVIARCKAWNETFFLPGRSPHLRLERDAKGDYVAHFNGEQLRFLARDVTVLPVANVSLEELARVFGEALVGDGGGMARDHVTHLLVKCASGPGQWASWEWTRDV